MKKTLLLLITVALTSVTIYSCKLDPPILPGDNGYVQQYPPTSGAIGSGGTTGSTGTTGTTGSTGTTGNTNNAALTGTWTVQSTAYITLLDGKAVSTQTIPVNPFDGVT